MKVRLINYTQDALELLIYTKNTRLSAGETLESIKKWPMEKKLEHLAYMKDTIKSSWEFVDYTFEITNVTRSFTHQLVRTRTASYAQQAQRVVDVRDAGFENPFDEEPFISMFDKFANESIKNYAKLIDEGSEVQRARGLLPTAIHTNIIMKANLRTLSQMAELRLCKRAEGEYQNVFKEIVERVVEVHPWAKPFLKVYCAQYGICAFPRYKDCPVKKYTIEIKQSVKDKIEKAWSEENHVANPVAKNGVTM